MGTPILNNPAPSALNPPTITAPSNAPTIHATRGPATGSGLAFPKIPNHGEFIYYIDAKKTLEPLVDHDRLSTVHPKMEDEVRMNSEADYAGAAAASQRMKLGFLKHALMVSRLHFMLEMASRSSIGDVAVTQWRQGAELRHNKVHVPELTSKRVAGSNEYRWEESDRTFRLPVEPDALFTLRFARRPP